MEFQRIQEELDDMGSADYTQRLKEELDEMLDGMGSADYTSTSNASDTDDGTSLFLASGGDEEKNEEKHEKKAKKDMLPHPISFIYSFFTISFIRTSGSRR